MLGILYIWDPNVDQGTSDPLNMAMITIQRTLNKTPVHSWLAPLPLLPSTRVLPPSSILDVINSSPVQSNGLCSSHAPGPVLFCAMDSFKSHSYAAAPRNNGLNLARSVFLLERTLLNVISGVGEGYLTEIPWESLPFYRAFMKERLALAAFFSCHCSPSDGGPLWRLNSGLGPNFSEGEVFSVESNLVLGCKCFGWKEETVGTLSCKCKADQDSLLREVSILHSALSEFFGSQVQDLEGAVNSLSLLALASCSPWQGIMNPTNENAGIADLKKNLCHLYDMMAIGIMDNKALVQEVKDMGEVVSYTSYQISNHDSRIDDTESNLRELMGKVDRIQEDLQRLVNMNQASQAHETPVAAQPMEEESVEQPVKQPG